MKKNHLFKLAVRIGLLLALPLATWAQSNPILPGAGTAEDPYQVASRADLEAVNGNLSAHYVLVNDISLADATYSGGVIGHFSGVFDGNGHTIQSFYLNVNWLNSNMDLGLFKRNSGEVKRLNLAGANILATVESYYYIGALVGRNLGRITHCTVSGMVNVGTYTDGVGGLCGINSGQLINCASDCSMTAGMYSKRIGGLCGGVVDGAVINCSARGSVRTENSSCLGGICGKTDGDGTIIANCYSAVTVKGGPAGGSSDCIGGICGLNQDGWIENCYATGTLSGGTAGGICGYNACSSHLRRERIRNCYSTAVVSGEPFGGICGASADQNTVINCFWDMDASGVPTSDGGAGKTTAGMLQQSTFANSGWDVSAVWLCGGSYPTLRWQGMPQAGPHTVTFEAGAHGQITGGSTIQLIPHTRDAVSPEVSADSGWVFMGWNASLTGIVQNVTLTAEYVQWQGAGTSDDPYLVTTRQHLEGINRNLDAHYRLANDIDLAALTYRQAVIAPFSGVNCPFFTGSFNGAGYTLKNLQIDCDPDPFGVGLFGRVTGSVCNLRIEGAQVDCRYWSQQGYEHTGQAVGVLAGLMDGGAEIRNCSVAGAVFGEEAVGLVVGLCNGGAVVQCFSDGRVDGRWEVGGLVGSLGLYGGEIRDCYSAAEVLGSFDDYAGGLLGYMSSGTVVRCFAVGSVTRAGTCGGVVGGAYGGSVGACFWDMETSGVASISVGEGKTTAEMKNQSTFTAAGWDFSENTGIWEMSPVGSRFGGHPILKWQEAGDVPGVRTITLHPGNYGTIGGANAGSNYVVSLPSLRPFPTVAVVPITDYVFIGFQPALPDIVTGNFEATAQYKRILPGAGTVGDPYRIRNRFDFNVFAADSTYWGGGLQVRLDGNIDLADTVYDQAVIAPDTNRTDTVYTGTMFNGVFDGNGYAIQNLKINAGTNAYAGLFGMVGSGGSVHNLHLEKASVSAGNTVGLLCAQNQGTLSNCVVAGGTVSGQVNTGGLCGMNGGPGLAGAIVNCQVTGGSVGGTSPVGGLCGFNSGVGTMADCYADAAVVGSYHPGGFCGRNYASITRCFSRGAVTGGSYGGGFCGWNGGGSITECFAIGAVTGSSTGGFCGDNYSGGVLAHCYSMGSVKGTSGGGFCYSNSSTVTACFWNTQTSGQATSAAGTGKTTTEMQALATFIDAGWDFTGEASNGTNDIWEMAAFPVLKNTPKPVFTFKLHPGLNGNIANANSGQDYVTTVAYGGSFPMVTVTPASGYAFVGWNPSAPAVVINDFETTAIYAGDGLFSFEHSIVSYNLGAGFAILSVTRDSATRAASVGYTTADGTLLAGTHYQAVSGTLDFVVGQIQQTFWVPILSGTAGAFSVKLVNPSALAGLGHKAVTTVQVSTAGSAPSCIYAPASLLEGESGTVWLCLPQAAGAATNLSVTSTHPTRLDVPATVEVAAGQQVISFNITAVADALRNGSPTVQLTLVCGDTTKQCSVLVQDDETPTLMLELPYLVMENAGVLANAGTVRVLQAMDTDVTVALSSSDTTELTVPATVVIPAGASSATFNLTVIDDGVRDGEVQVLVTSSSAGLESGIATTKVRESPYLSALAWSLISSSQSPNIAIPVTLALNDQYGEALVPYDGQVALTASGLTKIPSQQTIAPSVTPWGYPMATASHDARTQVIYLASQVGRTGTIAALALNVSTVPGQTLNNWTIRMRHTGLSSYPTAAVWESDWTTVYRANTTINNTGWVVFEFSTPFEYNGTSNLMVDFVHDNTSSTSAGSCVASRTLPRSLTCATDSAYGDPTGWPVNGYNPTPTRATYIPNIRLDFSGGMSTLAVTPSNASGFVDGVWAGSVVISEPGTLVRLGAKAADNSIWKSNSFDVIAQAAAGTFERWFSDHSLTGDPAARFCQPRSGDGLPHGVAYAFGSNLPADGPAQKIRAVNGRQVLEIPAQDAATLSYVGLRVLGSTNLIDWTLPVIQVAGAAAGRVWYQLDGQPTDKSFFKVEAELK